MRVKDGLCSRRAKEAKCQALGLRRKEEAKSRKSGPLWLIALEKHMPDLLKKVEIRILMHMTAAACQTAGSVWGRTSRDRLAAYRQFTVDIMAGRSREELLRYRRAMYVRAYRVGRLLSLLPGLHDEERKKRLIVLLYRNIEIEILDAGDDLTEDGDFKWRMHIPRCFFSAQYTPKICYVMSGFDAGIICGVFGGGTLRFSRRLTEGCSACSALYSRDVK